MNSKLQFSRTFQNIREDPKTILDSTDSVFLWSSCSLRNFFSLHETTPIASKMIHLTIIFMFYIIFRVKGIIKFFFRLFQYYKCALN